MLSSEAERRLADRLAEGQLVLDEAAEHDLAAVLARCRRLAGALDALANRVTRLCDFDANESAPPEDQRWAESLDELARYTNALMERFEQPPTPLGQDGPLLAKAVELVIASQFGSVSMLMRKLRISVPQAVRLLDLMEERGLVGPDRRGFARTVLVPSHRLAETVDAICRETDPART